MPDDSPGDGEGMERPERFEGVMAVLEWATRRSARPGKHWRERLRGLAAPLRRMLFRQRHLILSQALAAQGLMRLLMKPRNTGQPWTKPETRRIRHHLRVLAFSVPTLLIFLLPGGLLLLPILIEVLDRRRIPRE